MWTGIDFIEYAQFLVLALVLWGASKILRKVS
jgi:hypothetical protein